jgi:histidinol phosphatase-like PHP family hydrolase
MRVIAMLIEALQQCGRAVELILAHPDFEVWFGHLNREGNIGIDTMLTFLRENGIALEINVNTGYFFKKKDVIDALCDHSDPVVQALKQSETMLSIGTDSHGYEQVLFEGFNQVYAFFNEND